MVRIVLQILSEYLIIGDDFQCLCHFVLQIIPGGKSIRFGLNLLVIYYPCSSDVKGDCGLDVNMIIVS